MRILFLALLTIIALVASAEADMTANIARCAAIKSPTERLACYDALAKKLGIEGGKTLSTSKLTGTGKWRISTETSPIDDSKNVYLALSAEESIKAMLGTSLPVLFLRCKENKTEVYIAWGVYLGLEETTMLIRFDSKKATTSTWNISTDNMATFYRGSVIAFIRSIVGYKQLLVQVTPYGESPVMVTFDLAGLEEAVKQLQETCNWK
ncbi:MAG: hypothetical protein A2W23_07650 [Planctomycetes bacterium RBG_16_43_13]|nr:MAG: hypothetical protein A2W23_07650 [Planctomycetes bacterium RBG_16_43_13]